jgi:ribosomal protein L11 methyltransferase
VKKTYLEISIPALHLERELLMPQLLDLGCHGFMETDSALLAYLDRSHLTEEEFADLPARLAGIIGAAGISAHAEIHFIGEENWNLRWEESILPVEAGTRFVIKPSWQPYPNPDGRVVLEIDPKMSFGTGHHETTRLCLGLLEQHLRRGDRVLDVGTGTGVLAIGAMKLGAVSAVGIDIDEWSIENALENVKANGADEKVRVFQVSVEDFKGGPFDFILGNLTLNMITGCLPRLYELSAQHATVVLSGFLQSDLPAIQKNVLRNRFEPVGELVENGWAAVAARKARND